MYSERFKLRRTMAVVSFGLLIGLTLLTLGMVFVLGEEGRQNFAEVRPFLITLLPTFAGLVAHYGYMVHQTDKHDAITVQKHGEFTVQKHGG